MTWTCLFFNDACRLRSCSQGFLFFECAAAGGLTFANTSSKCALADKAECSLKATGAGFQEWWRRRPRIVECGCSPESARREEICLAHEEVHDGIGSGGGADAGTETGFAG